MADTMTTRLTALLLGVCAATATARYTHADLLIRRIHSMRGLPDDFQAPTPESSLHARSDDTFRFLSNTTASIPEVDFDVGESYAGQLPINERPNERDNLYFWFFPTSNEEQKDKKEIVIWLNGGPGCASLLGFLQENGSFQWKKWTLKPLANPWSWHHLTNVVWIEQPVTVGFSQEKASLKDEDDLSRQFLGFWKNFITLFSMQGWKVYIAAQSYGGYYGPYISSHMINANDTQHYDLGGLLIYNGLMFDMTIQWAAMVESYIEQHHDLMPLNGKTRKLVYNTSASCGFTDWNKKYLTYPPAGPAPHIPPGRDLLTNGSLVVKADCESLGSLFEDAMQVINPCFSVYYILSYCPELYDPIEGITPYFDRVDVKTAINVPLDVRWSKCTDGGVFISPGEEDKSEPPDKYELPLVIDTKKNVIIAHGAMDFLLPLNGVLLSLQNMTWGGMLGFQTAPSDPFYVPHYSFQPQSQPQSNENVCAKHAPAGSGVLGTTHNERGLTLVVTQLAGHPGPDSAPASTFRHLEKLLGRVESLRDTVPFTLPQLRNITQDKKPLGNGTVKIPCLGKGC